MLHFDPKIGLYADDVYVTREAVAEDWKGAFQKNGEATLRTTPESPAGQLIDAETAIITQKDNDLLFLANQFDPESSRGIWQDGLMSWFGLYRKQAIPPMVDLLCRGTVGLEIPKGSIVENADGLQFFTRHTATIGTNGTVSIPAYAQLDNTDIDGTKLIVPANTVRKIVTLIPGWDLVNNPFDGTPGILTESDEDFEARRKLVLAKNAQGTLPAMYSRLFQIDGVKWVKIQENTTDYPSPWVVGTSQSLLDTSIIVPAHSMAIVIYGGDDDEIAEAIYHTKAAGCGTFGVNQITYIDKEFFGTQYKYWIFRPRPLAIDFKITITGYGEWDPFLLKESVDKAIREKFSALYVDKPLWEPKIEASQFYCVLTDLGVTTLVQIQIRALEIFPEWQQDIDIHAIWRPLVGVVTIAV